MYKLISLHYHSGSAPGAQATQVSLSTGVHMSQFDPTDPRRYSTITAITLLISIFNHPPGGYLCPSLGSG